MDVWVNEARQALLKRRARLQARGDEDLPKREGPRVGLTEQEVQELQAIDEALRRMEGGAFGQCARCAGPIGRHRMRAVPEARYCLSCSTRMMR